MSAFAPEVESRMEAAYVFRLKVTSLVGLRPRRQSSLDAASRTVTSGSGTSPAGFFLAPPTTRCL